jgi:hypothetical protein
VKSRLQHSQLDGIPTGSHHVMVSKLADFFYYKIFSTVMELQSKFEIYMPGEEAAYNLAFKATIPTVLVRKECGNNL